MTKERQYYIPDNYTGNFNLGRKLAETVGACLATFSVISKVPFVTDVKMMVTGVSLLVVGTLFAVGVQGKSVTQFLIDYMRYFIRKRKLYRIKPYADVSEKGKKDKKATSLLQKSTQEWLGIEQIDYGLVVVNDAGTKRYIKILEIEPTNFHFMNAEQKNAIIADFYAWVKTAPGRFQFHITTTTQDTSEMMANIERNNIDKNAERIAAKNDYLRFIDRVGNEQSIKKRFLLVFEYEKGQDGIRATELPVIAEQMYIEEYSIREYFKKQGTQVMEHTSIQSENLFVGEVLYQCLNKKTSKTASFVQRINEVYEDAKLLQNVNEPMILDSHFVAANGMDFSHPEYVLVDGVYYTFLLFTSDGFRNVEYGGWLDGLTNAAGEDSRNVSITFSVKKKNKDLILGSLNQIQKNRQIESNRNSREGDGVKFEQIYRKFTNGKFIKERLTEYREDIYDATLLISISGESVKQLIDIKGKITKALKASDYEAVHCYATAEEAYRMSLPLGYMSRMLGNQSKRNFLTSSIASTFPFTAHEMYDSTGEVWGVANNGTMTSINLFNTMKGFINANMMIIGSSGGGKTFTEQCLGGRMCLNGKKVMFFLPIKGFEYRRRCKDIGGTYIQLIPGGKDCINLFEIRPSSAPDESLIEGASYGTNALTQKIAQIKTFLSLLLRDGEFEQQEEDSLDIHLVKLYERFGITVDDDSIFCVDGTLKRMPTFSDFKMEIEDDPLMRKIVLMINKFTDGTCKNFDGQTNVDLTNDYTVVDVDLDKIPKQLQAALLFLAINQGYQCAKESRTEQVMLVLDEVWKIMINRSSAEFVVEMMKIVRGYASGCMIATQDLDDLFRSGEIGRQIMNCAKTKLILATEESSIRRLKTDLGLNETECEAISKFSRGQGLLITPRGHMHVRIRASKREERYITTDPNRLRQIAEEERLKKGREQSHAS